MCGCPPLSESFLCTTSLLLKIYIRTCFYSPKEIWEGFSLLRKREESKNRVQHVFHSQLLTEAVPTQAVEHYPQVPSLRTALRPSASGHCILARCLWGLCFLFILYIRLQDVPFGHSSLICALSAYVHRNLYFQIERKHLVGKREKKGIKIPPLVEGSMWFCDLRNGILHLSTYIYVCLCVCMHMPLFSKHFTFVKSFHAYNSPTRKVQLPTVLQMA